MNADPLIGMRGADPYPDESDDDDPGYDLVPCANEDEAHAVLARAKAMRAAWRAKIGLRP